MNFDFVIFDILLEPCVILDKEQKVVYCNEAAALLFGLSVRKIIRSSLRLDQLIEVSESIPGLERLSEVTTATAIKEVSFKALQADYSGIIQISVQPISAENLDQHWVVFIRDVTLEEKLQKKYHTELEQKENFIKDLQVAQRQLQDYSKNLEIKVDERTRDLTSINQTMKALLDSLHQGFFIFGPDGVCLPVYSQACLEILEKQPAGLHLAEVLQDASFEPTKVNEWVQLLFEQMMPFEDAVQFGPSNFKHSQGKHIELSYYPMRDHNSQLVGVVTVASDVTSLVEARKEAEQEKNNARLVLNIVKNRKQILNFITDCRELIGQLNQQFSIPDLNRNPAEVYRLLHTLKGGASSFSIVDLTEHCHMAETVLSDIRNGDGKIHSFSEKWQELVALIKQIEEDFTRFLNYTEHIIGKTISEERTLEITFSQFVDLIQKTDQLMNNENIKKVLTEEFLMEPIGLQIDAYRESTKKLAESLNKQIMSIDVAGGYIKIIPEYYKNLFSALVHIFRNAVDHGIETPDVRQSLGKPPAGLITFEFVQLGDTLKMNIIDDGAGIDPAIIRKKLLEKGLDTGLESDEQVIQHIFDAGFSTKENVTRISGRGVGMDAVKAAVDQLKGKIKVLSRKNFGTIITIEVPYLNKLSSQNKNSKKKLAA